MGTDSGAHNVKDESQKYCSQRRSSNTRCCVLYNPNDIVENRTDSEVRCRIINRTKAIRKRLCMPRRNLAFHKLIVVATTRALFLIIIFSISFNGSLIVSYHVSLKFSF